MCTDKQAEANKLNAQKSTGPVSITGKQRSSLNAIRHGLTGHVVVLPQEDIEAFKSFTTPIVTSLLTLAGSEDAASADAHERQLALMYAGIMWRVNRANAVEDSMFTLGLMENVAENLNLEHPEVHNAASNAKTFRQEAAAFDRVSLYTQRLVNSANKVLKQLKDCQAERRARERQLIDEATRIYQFLCMQEKTFDPRENGFDFSLRQIETHITREHLRKHSANAANVDFNRVRYVKEYGNLAA